MVNSYFHFRHRTRSICSWQALYSWLITSSRWHRWWWRKHQSVLVSPLRRNLGLHENAAQSGVHAVAHTAWVHTVVHSCSHSSTHSHTQSCTHMRSHTPLLSTQPRSTEQAASCTDQSQAICLLVGHVWHAWHVWCLLFVHVWHVCAMFIVSSGMTFVFVMFIICSCVLTSYRSGRRNQSLNLERIWANQRRADQISRLQGKALFRRRYFKIN